MKLFLCFYLIITLFSGCSKKDSPESATEGEIPSNNETIPSTPENPVETNPEPPIVELNRVFEFDESLGLCINDYQQIGYNNYKSEYLPCTDYSKLDLSDIDFTNFNIEGSIIQKSSLKNTKFNQDQLLQVVFNKNNITDSDFSDLDNTFILLYQKNNSYKNVIQNIYQNKLHEVLEMPITDKSSKFNDKESNEKYFELERSYYLKYGEAGFKFDDKKNDFDNKNVKTKIQDLIKEKNKYYSESGLIDILDLEKKIEEVNKKISEILINSLDLRSDRDLYIFQLNETRDYNEKQNVLSQIKDNKIKFEENHKLIIDISKSRFEIEERIQEIILKNLDIDSEISALKSLEKEFPEKI